MKLKENMRYSTYAEKEEEDNEFIRDEDLLMMDHLSQHHFSNSDEDEEFEDRLMQNTDEVVTH
jgi:hypothetical protein